MKTKKRIKQLEWDVGMLQGRVDQLFNRTARLVRQDKPDDPERYGHEIESDPSRITKATADMMAKKHQERHLPPSSGWVYYSKYGYVYVGSPDDAYIKTN